MPGIGPNPAMPLWMFYSQLALAKLWSDQVRPDHVRPDHACSDQVRPDHVLPDQVRPLQARDDQVRPDQVLPAQGVIGTNTLVAPSPEASDRPNHTPPTHAAPRFRAAARWIVFSSRPKISTSPSSFTPSITTRKLPRLDWIDPLPLLRFQRWVYEGVAARSAVRKSIWPLPCCCSVWPGSGVAEDMSRRLTWSGVADGRCCTINAAAPATTAEDCEEPDPRNLRHVVLGRGQAVDECAVVGQQQEAGGVLVQPPNRLQAAPLQGRRQQAEHAGMVAGLA